MEDLSLFCCQNPDCPDYGQRGIGNLTVCVSRMIVMCTSRKSVLRCTALTFVGRFGRWPIATSGVWSDNGRPRWRPGRPTTSGRCVNGSRYLLFYALREQRIAAHISAAHTTKLLLGRT
jgi:hypothetical protein